MIPGVIVVDDSPEDQYLAKRAIERGGVSERVVMLNDGRELLDLLDDRPRLHRECGVSPPPLLVLLDVKMPRMSGFEVLEELERRLGDPRSKEPCYVVMMVTSSGSEGDRDTALRYSFVTDYLVKPVDAQKLRELVEQHFQPHLR